MANDTNNMHINLSASGEKIKYYESDDDICIFEISDEDPDFSNIDMDCDLVEEKNHTVKGNYNFTGDNEDLLKINYDLTEDEMDSIKNNYNSQENDYELTENNNIDSRNFSYENCESDIQKHDTLNDSELNGFSYYNNQCPKVRGEIVVISSINCGGKNEYLEGAKINLYKLNGVCPVFIESCLTNKQGKVVFENLPEGCYRIIEIVNKNYFEKPKYVNWNEVNINRENTNAKILVMNNLKKNCRYR
ncbi:MULTISPECIES: prealbumin-like fold domain-containing protein [unclassified Clostridium]|uniref:prealbumin-like fold domain-containing protein n=1 Tax=unclassified Clostridium TaxID=2614128 RepID=UPI0013F08C30|nr:MULTISPECIES: prealbumin-like fold domain-containing protein [unclassified Clostridium]NFG60702.1 hypothetical protein [Clostridium botulinum]NFQ10512.1 hypothetical protein [Clostridium botulinum]